jgi:DNA polymerase-4
LEAVPVKKFHGVGPATAERMKRHGIEIGLDLKGKSLALLQHQRIGGDYEVDLAVAVAKDRAMKTRWTSPVILLIAEGSPAVETRRSSPMYS